MPDYPSGQIVEMVRELCDVEVFSERWNELVKQLDSLLDDETEPGGLPMD